MQFESNHNTNLITNVHRIDFLEHFNNNHIVITIIDCY